MHYFAGIDEAGLGPLLGPYCCAGAGIISKSDTSLKEQFLPLFDAFPGLSIDDSKKIYWSSTGLASLEKRIFAYLPLFGLKADNLQELLSVLLHDPSVLNDISTLPWYQDLNHFQIPVELAPDEQKKLADGASAFCTSQGIQFYRIQLNIATAKVFNSKLTEGLNKGELGMFLISPLLSAFVHENAHSVTVDRLGGRKFYGDWLINLFPKTPISALQETKTLSRYRIRNSLCRFQEKADSTYLTTGLASLFAKYARELMMKKFNQYWQKIIPDIKPTAGYYTDGKRFLADLTRLNQLPKNTMDLIRQK